jgi:hypothetical protein
MGLDDDGDPPAGQTEEAVDTVVIGMDIEETTDEFLNTLGKNSGSTSLQKEAARSARKSSTMATMTATTGFAEEGMERWQYRKDSSTSISTSTSTMTATGMKKIDEEDEEAQEEAEEEDKLKMKTRNWRNINLSFAVVLEGRQQDETPSNHVEDC